MMPLPNVFRMTATACKWAGLNSASLFSATILLSFALSLHASAQTTSVSGTVYDPRTTASALPLPGVLVYVTTGKVDPLPAGVQCLTFSTPTGVVSYTYTGVDGTFTIKKVPLNTSYTLVIQAGKWRRKLPVTVGTNALTGLTLHMPSNHSEGDIPMIAIATGAADGVECVLHDMGISDSEFTDDNGTVNPGGHIHLYQGDGNPGASISPSTPSDTVLTGDVPTLNSYDMVMFPCQGGSYIQSDTALSNILNFANAGGRIFTTHYSFIWLDPDAPYNSKFPPVANWHPNYADPAIDPGVATVNTGFTDGATLAQWLENAGATSKGQPGQVQIGALRHDIDSVIPPTQSWLNLNDAADGNPVMQLTFNAPVNAPAAQQCGRVLFNEYHVIDLDGTGKIYPSECPTGPMSAQEEMLEYALFDLSTFVTPVVVPTLTVGFSPSPMIVKQGDSADDVTITATNTSTNTAIDPSAKLSITLPQGLTAVAINDPTKGWNCVLSTLQCTRTTSIPSTVSDAVTLTVSVDPYPAGGPSKGSLKVTISSPTFSNDVVATDVVDFQQKATITWPTPAPIVYGTALSATQLDAKSTVAGTFLYTPAVGTVLAAGQQTLSVVFTPTDGADYIPTTATVTLTVVPQNLAISVTPSPNPAFVSNAVTITATIPSPAGAPTGTVSFYDGEIQLGSSTISGGTASFTTSAMALGAHTIMAVYSGDANYKSSNSTSMQESIEDFNLAPGSGNGSPTVFPGGGADFTFVVSPLGGPSLAGAVNLSVDGLPVNATAEFSPAVVAAYTAQTKITLHVKTAPLSASEHDRNPIGKGTLPIAFGLVLLPFAARLRKARHRWIPMALLSIAGAALALGVTGCGGITYTPKNFTMTVKASAGNLSHSTPAKITVE
jgi:hypothetical protein